MMTKYDVAGLDIEWNPKYKGKPILTETVLSSDLPRALETALLMTEKTREQMQISPLYREVPLPRFKNTERRLPVPALFALSRLGWLTGTMQCEEGRAASLVRVRQTADILEGLCRENKIPALFSHGFFLLLLGRELRHRGWLAAGPGMKKPYKYLERRVFMKDL